MTSAVSDRVVIGRQSIHDRNLAVVGYELRFGGIDSAPSVETADDPAEETGITSDVVFGALSVGLDRLVGDKRVFLDADRSVLLDPTQLALVPARSVIEVQPETAADADALRGCRELADVGFAIAVDGFAGFDGMQELLKIAAIVKVDVQAVSAERLHRLVPRCQDRDVQVLADRVETPELLADLRETGVDLFQGFALHKPTVATGRPLGAINLARLRMSASVIGQQLDFDEIEELLRTEPGMTYQVLQLASLGRYGENRRQVHTVREALVLAGSWRIQSWISLLIACPVQDAPRDAITAALARARACELLARAVGQPSRTAFTAGMISAFEPLLGVSADELSRSLPLADELREAAFGGRTSLGRLVRDVADHQAGTLFPRRLSGVAATQLDAAMAMALQWAWQAASVLD